MLLCIKCKMIQITGFSNDESSQVMDFTSILFLHTKLFIHKNNYTVEKHGPVSLHMIDQ